VQASRPKADVAIEVGPGKVLAGLNKRIDKTLTTLASGDPAAIAAIVEQSQGN